MKNKTGRGFVIGLGVLTLFAFSAGFGAEMKMTPELRQKMADSYQKQAECLRTDKPISQCEEQMEQSCQAMLGKDECPICQRRCRVGSKKKNSGRLRQSSWVIGSFQKNRDECGSKSF